MQTLHEFNRLGALKNILLICILCTLQACANLDFGATKFQPLKTDANANYFTFTAYGDAAYPENSNEAEQIRIEWLNRWLSENNITNKNLTIVSRSAVKKQVGLFGTIYDIYYVVKVDK
ncbi:hypothetical protein UFOVP13_28 [uncultured Caudovirales phage]|uniref:Uncharacterized protein n=1 Tax=uncultured Caudovirales phage TaxID=2100421 RepID=A0A6J5KJI3_9CAUD|nr:hypothetical protein UFOVP13_28 [uncultured Caudovirales phage]